jgi:hypothetical protein
MVTRETSAWTMEHTQRMWGRGGKISYTFICRSIINWKLAKYAISVGMM